MTNREGNLEAPTRHAVDWRNPAFYDAQALEKEMERVFDICHGCRRCVSLCQAFPTLFDLVDASPTLEVDGVAKQDYAKVVDQCYLCDLCYMTKCPYVPPHPWNVDFPHLMLRAKAIKFRNGEDARCATGCSPPPTASASSRPSRWSCRRSTRRTATPAARKVMDKALGVATDARSCRRTRTRAFATRRKHSIAWPVRDGERTPGKVAIFSTCYVNYNEPGIGHDLLAVLAHNEIPYASSRRKPAAACPSSSSAISRRSRG